MIAWWWEVSRGQHWTFTILYREYYKYYKYYIIHNITILIYVCCCCCVVRFLNASRRERNCRRRTWRSFINCTKQITSLLFHQNKISMISWSRIPSRISWSSCLFYFNDLSFHLLHFIVGRGWRLAWLRWVNFDAILILPTLRNKDTQKSHQRPQPKNDIIK